MLRSLGCLYRMPLSSPRSWSLKKKKKKALLINNLQGIQSTHFKYTIQWFLANLTRCAIFTRTFPTAKKFLPACLHFISAPTPSPRKPLVCFVLKFYLFWTFQTHEIMHCVVFCIWLFSPSIKFVPLCCWVVFLCVDMTYFVYPCTSWWTFMLFLV